MKISIITPSYSQGQYIEETIISVIEQNFPDLEYIIIDGGSTDSSVEVIKKYAKDLTYWISEPDHGQSAAINKGFKKATGEIIGWINSDDLYMPETLKTVSHLFEKNPDVDLIYGDVINFHENGKEEYYSVKIFNPKDFISMNTVHQPSVFWRRKLLNDIGPLDESLNYFMDYDLWMRVFFKYKTLKISQPLSKFRIHQNSKTYNNPPEMYLEYRKVLSAFFNSFEEPKLTDKLKTLDIYSNEMNKKYDFPKMDIPLKKMLNSYIHQSAVQEYSWKNIKKANNLFFSSMTEPSILTNLAFLLKNNLGIKYLRP